uniref:Uncharacterized protein n=1 Tax=Haemonchus contortus TaxID=6289 RepID=W6NF14_HAECO
MGNQCRPQKRRLAEKTRTREMNDIDKASVAAIAAAAFDDEVDNDTNHLVESTPSSPVVAAMVDGLAPDHTQTQENIIAEEPIGYSPTTTSPKKVVITMSHNVSGPPKLRFLGGSNSISGLRR